MLKRQQDMQKRSRPNLKGGNGVMRDLICLTGEEMLGKCINFSKLLIDPGVSIAMHDHTDNAEIYYVVKGEAVTSENGVETVMHEGDISFTGGGASHFIENRTNAVVEVLAIILP